MVAIISFLISRLVLFLKSNISSEDLNYYFSMINSYPRKSLDGKCPIDVIDEIYGKDFHQKLNLKKLSLKEIDFRIRRK